MVLPLNSLDLFGFKVFNGTTPREGPKALAIVLDFTLAASYFIDLTLQVQQGIIQTIQTLFVDASQSQNEITFQMAETGQTIIIPNNCQVYMPVLMGSPPRFTASATLSVNTGIIPVQLLNFALPGLIWPV